MRGPAIYLWVCLCLYQVAETLQTAPSFGETYSGDVSGAAALPMPTGLASMTIRTDAFAMLGVVACALFVFVSANLYQNYCRLLCLATSRWQVRQKRCCLYCIKLYMAGLLPACECQCQGHRPHQDHFGKFFHIVKAMSGQVWCVQTILLQTVSQQPSRASCP